MKFGTSKQDTAADTPSRGAQGPAADSVIGAGLVIEGGCATSGSLRVDGRVTGAVRARTLVVGPEGVIEGDVMGPDGEAVRDGVMVEGRVEGALRAKRAEVGPQGYVGDGLEVDEATIRGRVRGSVTARERLMLEESAVVEGDVTAERLGVREGGRVAGLVRIGRAAE